MFTLENDKLKIKAINKGAELVQIYSKETGLEYLWDADPKFWAKHSPILFPIVGTLKNDIYFYQDKKYTLTRHGFARDMNFELSAQTKNSLTFTLTSNAETLAKYPFEFKLDVVYSLEENTLKTLYNITYTGKEEMYFSVGGHPAFRIPLDKDSLFEDYYIEFEEKETAGRWPISPEGLIEALPLRLIQDSNILEINHELFAKDAIVFKYLNSKSLQLKSRSSSHGLEFHFEGFPFLGIWSGKNGNFVCIEPWCGIADSTASHQQLIRKEGINMLTPDQSFSREWKVSLF